jgi:hypothetical protein
VAAIVRAAADADERVKVIGAGHSFTDVAMTDGHLISLDDMDRVLAVTGNDVTVQAGIRLFELNERLAAVGLAMPNLGDMNNTIQHGTVATIRAATPDGIVCSAHTTAPLPPSRRNAPVMAAVRHCFAVAGSAPRNRVHNRIIPPAMTKRTPAIRNGGSVSIANRMARYVEPQMI